MKFAILSALIFVAVLEFASSTSCVDVCYQKLHPLDCCIYPKIFEEPEVEKKCKENCTNAENNSRCQRVCYLKEIGAYVDEKFVPEAIKKTFENGKNETEKVKESTRGPLDEAWGEVIDKSIKICDGMHKHNSTIPEDKITNFVFLYIVCLRMQNYLNCPDMNQSKDCEDLNNMIKTCDPKTHNTLFGAFREQRKHLQKQNKTGEAGGLMKKT